MFLIRVEDVSQRLVCTFRRRVVSRKEALDRNCGGGGGVFSVDTPGGRRHVTKTNFPSYVHTMGYISWHFE